MFNFLKEYRYNPCNIATQACQVEEIPNDNKTGRMCRRSKSSDRMADMQVHYVLGRLPFEKKRTLRKNQRKFMHRSNLARY